jgi:hypothetical protein
VTRADRVEAELERPFEQGGELDLLVAAHARVRRAARAVLGDEVVDDVVAEALGEVPDVERDAERSAARRASIASSIVQQPRLPVRSVPRAREREVHADDVVTGVDAAAATAESTPPLMAARIRIGPVYEGAAVRADAAGRHSRPGVRTWEGREQRIDIAGDGGAPERERSTDRATSWSRPRASTTCEGSATPAWHADRSRPRSLLVEQEQHRLPHRPGRWTCTLPARRPSIAQQLGSRDRGADAGPEPIAERHQPLVLADAFGLGILEGDSQRRGAGDVLCPSAARC